MMRKMAIDCLLVYPIPTKDSPTKGPALSIFYPGAMLEKAGFKVEYFDERFDDLGRLLTLLERDVLCVGVSSMTGYQLAGAKRILEMVKRVDPAIFTIFGGAHPTILPQECIGESFIDFVVTGEGEETLLELITALKGDRDFRKIDGLLWKQGYIFVNKPRKFMLSSEWPFPMTAKNRRYFEMAAERGELMLQSSRGCPFNCSFCYNQIMNRGTWRPMPVEKFEREMAIFVQEFGIKNIYVDDDNIGASKKRIALIAGIMKKFNLAWTTGIRCSDVDDEAAEIFGNGGCRELLLGVESGSDRILKEVVNKGYSKGTEDIRNCARALAKTRIRGRYNFMSGVPTETPEEVRQSMDLADWIYKTDKNALFCFDAYAPYPGTRLYKLALQKTNFKEPKNLEEWSRVTLSNETNPVAQNLYYISGLRFRGKKGDATSRNFPGFKRLLIMPFEISAHIRWRLRWLRGYGLEKAIVKRLFSRASKR